MWARLINFVLLVASSSSFAGPVSHSCVEQLVRGEAQPGPTPEREAFFQHVFNKIPKNLNLTAIGSFVDDFATLNLAEPAVSLAKEIWNSTDIHNSQKLTPGERRRIGDFLESWEKTVNEAYSGPNRQLLDINAGHRFEPTFFGNLDELVKQWHFDDELWWVSSRRFARITGETSLSPLRTLYGNDSFRTLHWPRARLDGPPHLGSIRIAVNWEKNKPRSIEIMAKDASNIWLPFFYERIGNTWLPRQKFLGENLNVACARCHGTAQGLRPIPPFIDDAKVLKQIGFKDSQIIEKLLLDKNFR